MGKKQIILDTIQKMGKLREELMEMVENYDNRAGGELLVVETYTYKLSNMIEDLTLVYREVEDPDDIIKFIRQMNFEEMVPSDNKDNIVFDEILKINESIEECTEDDNGERKYALYIKPISND